MFQNKRDIIIPSLLFQIILCYIVVHENMTFITLYANGIQLPTYIYIYFFFTFFKKNLFHFWPSNQTMHKNNDCGCNYMRIIHGNESSSAMHCGSILCKECTLYITCVLYTVPKLMFVC